MIGIRMQVILAGGLILPGASALAQGFAGGPAGGYVSPSLVAEPFATVPPPAGCPAQLTVPGPAPTRVTPTPAPRVPPPCSCGNRHGLSRWYWHRTQCRRKHQQAWIGYPEEFNEWPLGQALYANSRVEVANAQAARMIFYNYDFVDGTVELNQRGNDKLMAMTPMLGSTFNPVIIERTPHVEGLDQARRLTVLARLATSPFPVPAERVVVGPPIAGGMRGIDSFLVERNRLGAMSAGGALGGVLGGGGTTSGAAPLDKSGMTGSVVGGAGIR